MRKQIAWVCSILISALVMLSFTFPVYAAGGVVSNLTVSGDATQIQVSGTTTSAKAAVAVQVLDSGLNIVAMENFVISSQGTSSQGTFSGSLEGLSLTRGVPYTVRAADYDGGAWKTTTFIAKAEHASVQEMVVYLELKDTDNSEIIDVAAHLNKYDPDLAGVSFSSTPVTTGNIQADQVTGDGKMTVTLVHTANNGDTATIPVTVSSDRYEDFVLNVKVVAKKMTTEAITVPDDGASTGSGTVTASVTQDTAAPKTTLANLTSSKIKALLTPAEQTAVAGGATADLCFEVQKADATVPAADKTKVTGKVASDIPGGTVGMYLDLSLSVEIGGTARQVTDTGTQSLPVKVQLPDSLKNTDTTKDRTYYIVRVHEGTATVLPVTFDGTNLTFYTDKFSTYAIVYKDTPKTTGGTSGSSSSSSAKSNPTQKVAAATGDSTPVGLYVMLLLASAAVLVYLGRKKFKASK